MSQVIRTLKSTTPGELNTIEYRLLTQDRVEDALAIQLESMQQEVLAIGVGICEENGAAMQMQSFFREVVKDGCTVIAVDINTDKVVAVAFNKTHARLKDGETDPLAVFAEKNINSRACLDLIKFLENVESQINLFETYNASGAMEIFYVGTALMYRGKGIGQQIVEASLQFGRGLLSGKFHKVPVCEYIMNDNVVPQVAFGVFTSCYSQRIAQKLGFNQLFEMRYEDYMCNGRKLSERIGPVHKTACLAAIKL